MWCKKILVAYDGSAPFHRALEVMREIAAQNPAVEVVLVHVMRLFSSGSRPPPAWIPSWWTTPWPYGKSWRPSPPTW